MEIVSHSEIFENVLVIGHQPPSEDTHFLIERNLVDGRFDVGSLVVNDVLEVLRKAHVERIKIDPSVDYFQKSVVLIDGQIFNYSLGLGLDLLFCARRRNTLLNKASVNFSESRVASINKVTEVVNGRWFVLDQNEEEMEGQSSHCFPITCRINRTYKWNTLRINIINGVSKGNIKRYTRKNSMSKMKMESKTYISCAIIRNDCVDQRHKQILYIFAPAIGQVRRKWVQDD